MIQSSKMICKKCGSKVKIPFVWILGLEIVFRCQECKARYKTGYKMGAFILAMSLVIVLVAANLIIYITSSVLIPVVAIFIIPVWIYLGFKLRLLWLKSKR